MALSDENITNSYQLVMRKHWLYVKNCSVMRKVNCVWSHWPILLLINGPKRYDRLS